MLDVAPELNKKHTIFGKVTGDSIFNLLRFNNLEVDADDRPVKPPKVLGVQVLLNPFEDIVPRAKPKPVEAPKEPTINTPVVRLSFNT